MTTAANLPIIEICDVCRKKIDTSKDAIFFCTDYKGRCRECYAKWVGMIAS
jgi:hypothetical protein